MGLRLGETLALQVGDIDAERKLVHIRRGKGHKDRLVPLPRGFRRVRDYGFLHGNAKKMLALIQLVLRVIIEIDPPRPRPVFKCPKCKAPMTIIGFRRPVLVPG
jgi:integrase